MNEETNDKSGYRLIKPAATGEDRGIVVANIEAIIAVVGQRAAADGLTETRLATLLGEPG